EGVEVLENTAANIKGRMSVGIGPISASFTGAASIERDDSTMTGRIVGAGNDKRSSTRTRGEVVYRLASEGETATRVSLTADYNLQGPLAQFSRTSVVQEI